MLVLQPWLTAPCIEARLATGIWGGLLSLPELPAGAEAGEWAAQRFACRVIAIITRADY
jgi:hypothetical protein